jgi:hypothetical protein
MRVLGRAAVAAAIVLGTGWASLALALDGPASGAWAGALGAAFALSALALLLGLRPMRRALLALLILWLLVLGWWLGLAPSNAREWQADVAHPPVARIDGDRLTIENVRDFDYRSETDYTERWVTRRYDLSKLRGVDLFLCFWGPTLIAHTIMSWEFDDGQRLAISIETRKEKGESYSALRGFFRRYELYYVISDERDLVRLRTNYRGESVFLYRMAAPPQRARAVLLAYLEQVNALARKPRWYNALTHNCTTTIRLNALQAGVAVPWDWRFLANGRSDEMLYQRGSLNRSLAFAELRRRSDITARARSADRDPAFSQRIREGLPPRPGVSAPAPV